MYYSYHAVSGGKPVPDGGQISIGNAGATFSQGSGSAGASASCPAVSALVGGVTLNTVQTGGVANQTTADFPTYIFMGGLQNNGTMTLGPGQYVMAGTNSTNWLLVRQRYRHGGWNFERCPGHREHVHIHRRCLSGA